MKRLALVYLPLLAVALGMASCSEDPGIGDLTSQKWQESLKGHSDPRQNWVTAVNMQLNIIDNGGNTVSVYTIGEETPVLLGQKEMKGNGVMRLDIPQGAGNSIGVISDGKGGRLYQRVYLSNDKKQEVDIDFTNGTNSSVIYEAPQSSGTRAVNNPYATPLPTPTGTHNKSLDGNTIAECTKYLSTGGWAWDDILAAMPEGKPIDNKGLEGLDYEFTSDGYQGKGEYGDSTIFEMAYLYGYTGCKGTRIIGYYTHSEGTYDDFKMYDLGECLAKDYLASPGSDNYQAKVQYQLDGNDTWYDANFWYTDGEGVLKDEKGKLVSAKDKSPSRHGDGIYNSFLVHHNYGERVSGMRGLSYRIAVAKGLKYGFYLRIADEKLRDAHKKILQNKGIDISKVTSEVNFSSQDLNQEMSVNGRKVYFRSAYKKFDNFSFIGFDDGAVSGDADCNDVTFGFFDADGRAAPHKANPKDSLQHWTIAFENQGRDDDFDFNDVVIRVTPNPETRKARVELLAAGCVYRTELYFGSKKLCEVHEAFGKTANSKGWYGMVNTENANSIRPAVDLGEVDLPEDFTISEYGRLFNTKVYAEEKTYTASPGTYIGADKDTPTAICVSGKWKWPMERTNIFEAYPLIGEWGKNVTDTNYWNWYSQPRHESVMGAE